MSRRVGAAASTARRRLRMRQESGPQWRAPWRSSEHLFSSLSLDHEMSMVSSLLA